MSGINNKLLTIIIPTYNRKEEVRENLENTIPMVMNYKDKVSIYVSDNASTDGTKEMVNRYVEKYPDIVSYYCHKENITASPNFNHAVHAVSSEYCYILGDDDVLSYSFVESVLSLLKSYSEIGLIHFNYLIGNDNYKKCHLLHENIPNKQIRIYENGADFIFDMLDSPSFISSNIFKRELWLKGSSHINDDHPGFSWFSVLLYGSLDYKCMYYSYPLIIQGCPSKNNYAINWAWYYIYGQGSLFKKLDIFKEGIFCNWQDKIQNQKRQFTKMVLIVGTSIDRHLYRQRYEKMNTYISDIWLKYLLWSSVYIFPRWFSLNVINSINRLFGVFHKLR